ncbi:hypothetical protein QMK17_24905 [Rhodococcus sp. G-MC3]|uniref:hypothetical protein n=1 Tax=Rhodococcus sp. G-MC3 TaxID=3046209 RepID=UPI0024BA4F65|nr:hypothetical protein [Rhodococcus sp. G-MC3]MDJ0396545.1 hypothetical protein [Rhodococcus sp. G-MC3]
MRTLIIGLREPASPQRHDPTGRVYRALTCTPFPEEPKKCGDNSFGVLTRTFGGGIDVMLSIPFKFVKKTVEPPTPSREDMLVGIVTAAAFGTGGLSASTIVMGAVASLFP